MKITLVAGARPNFMKVAPIIRALEEEKAVAAGLSYQLVHTGQHYDDKLSNVFFEQLHLPQPHANLAAGSGSQAEQTGRIMIEFERYLQKNPTDLVVVVGDVNSTLACAVVAKKMLTEVAHVEAGIRSFDLSMPEEINRMVTDSITDYFFTTSEVANQNLREKGVDSNRLFFVGNTMIDTLLASLPRAQKPEIWSYAGLEEGKYLVVTLHRPSNVDQMETLRHWLKAIDLFGIPTVFPVHPRTRVVFNAIKEEFSHIFSCDPLSYLEFIYLLKYSKAVITDSGGVQEETTVLQVPCFTLRTSTERPETITMGTNVLIGSDTEYLRLLINNLSKERSSTIPPNWDGESARRIVEALIRISQNKKNGNQRA